MAVRQLSNRGEAAVSGAFILRLLRHRAVYPWCAVFGQVDEIEIVLTRPLQGQAGRCREADQGLDAGTQDFLDQFEAATAGDDGQATLSIDALAQQRADQLVQRVVAPDVLTA